VRRDTSSNGPVASSVDSHCPSNSDDTDFLVGPEGPPTVSLEAMLDNLSGGEPKLGSSVPHPNDGWINKIIDVPEISRGPLELKLSKEKRL